MESLINDIPQLQLHPLNTKLAEAGRTLSAAPRLSQIHMIPAENVSTVKGEIADNEQNSPGDDPISAKFSHVVQEPSNDCESTKSVTAGITSGHSIMNISRPQTPRSTDNTTDADTLLLVKQIIQHCANELKSFDHTKQRVDGEEEILTVLKNYVAAFDENNTLFRIDSAFYRSVNQKSDFNMLVRTSKNGFQFASHFATPIPMNKMKFGNLDSRRDD